MKELEQLASLLSQSTSLVDVSGEVLARIEHYRALLPEAGLGRLFELSCRASKVAAHARQGDLSYLFEKLTTKIFGRDDWASH